MAFCNHVQNLRDLFRQAEARGEFYSSSSEDDESDMVICSK